MDPHHLRSGIAARAPARGDHHRVVTVALKVLQHPQDGVRYPVDRGQEALAHDRDAHNHILGAGVGATAAAA
jgi:hypothetical protein